MKFAKAMVLTALLLSLSACGEKTEEVSGAAVHIRLSDEVILVDGSPIATDAGSAVYAANDIVYYEAGKDFTYGEGSEADAHSPQEAAAHTVVHISEPGTYSLSGTLSRGQIAVDLGEDAKKDPEAVVTLILDGVDISCEVAPAVIFYEVYECGDKDKPDKDVDTAAAGANVLIADGTENHIRGSYVARIYKPDSVELNAKGTKVKDAKKLHKYDAAFYSRMSMNIRGGEEGSGILNIRAENEGLDSEMHLTIHSGNINISSGNDGINTNEDGVSVTTIHGGTLNIRVTGETGEGDGIDSNGWLVINGGIVTTSACSDSMDAGIDSDMGIHINGGMVVAGGNMLDRLEDGGQTYAVFSFAQKQSGADTLYLKDEQGNIVIGHCPGNDYSVLVFSSDMLKEGNYTLWSGERQLTGQSGMMSGFPGKPPEGMPSFEGMAPPDGAPPMGERPAEFKAPPAGEIPPERPQGPGGDERPVGERGGFAKEGTAEFRITAGANMFGNIA